MATTLASLSRCAFDVAAPLCWGVFAASLPLLLLLHLSQMLPRNSLQFLAAPFKADNAAPELTRVGCLLHSSTAFPRVQVPPLRRHSLVWLSQAPQPALAGESSVVDKWHADGNPFVVCRQRGQGDLLALGFCLPAPGQRPRRIGVNSRSGEIVRLARPPSLGEIAAILRSRASAAEQLAAAGKFTILSDAAAKAGLDPRVFGSWMWQALTGGSHVNESSDLDVLIDVSTASDAGRAADFLQGAAADYPFVVDGELSISGLGEVHWREYLNGEPDVLVKSIDAVRMFPRDELWK